MLIGGKIGCPQVPNSRIRLYNLQVISRSPGPLHAGKYGWINRLLG